MSEQNNDIDILAPLPSKVRIAGLDREIEVHTLKMGQLMQVVKLFQGGKLANVKVGGDLLDIIEVLPDEMMQLAMIATGLTKDELNQAEVDEFVILVATILERNRDFFARKLGQSLKVLAAQLAKILALTVAAGSTHSGT